MGAEKLDLTAIAGIRVGHWTNLEAATGCTVVLCPEGAVAGVDVRGSAPATRETDLLNPTCLVDRVHAILLAGGSAFGLSAADGVMRWLEERGHGFRAGSLRVPIVPAAALFDLNLGRSDVRPDGAAGYACCQSASQGPVPEGNVGAGTGATSGKLLGPQWATKSGLGTAGRRLPSGLTVAALAVANPLGDVVDPYSAKVLAGTRLPDGTGFADSLRIGVARERLSPDLPGANTTLAVVATDAGLSKSQAAKVAQMAQAGLARVLRPSHTPFDGDTVFSLSLGERSADLSLLGALAAELVSQAIVSGILAAQPCAGLPSARSMDEKLGEERA